MILCVFVYMWGLFVCIFLLIRKNNSQKNNFKYIKNYFHIINGLFNEGSLNIIFNLKCNFCVRIFFKI